MQKRLADKSSMYDSIRSLLNSNKEAWQPVAVLAEIVDTFEALLDEIKTCRQFTGENNKGITRQKAIWQQQLIGIAYQVASALYVMAMRANNPVLAHQVDYTETDLLKTRDMQLVTHCRVIEELATKHLPALAGFGVTANELDELRKAIQRFSESLPTLRVSVSERKAANMKLKELFAQTDALLKNQLDRLMVRLRETHPDLYATYQNTRRIVQYGIRHEKSKGTENEGGAQ